MRKVFSIIVLILFVGLIIFLFPKRSSYNHTQLYYQTYGGSGLDNYGRECSCYGWEIDKSMSYETVKQCFGIPTCQGLY